MRVLLLFLMLLSLFSLAPTSMTIPPPQPNSYWAYYYVQLPGPGVAEVSVNESAQLYIFTPPQYTQWEAQFPAKGEIVDLSSGENYVNLSAGEYVLVVPNLEPNQVFVNLTPLWVTEQVFIPRHYSLVVNVSSEAQLYLFTPSQFQEWENLSPFNYVLNLTLSPGLNRINSPYGNFVVVILGVERAGLFLTPHLSALIEGRSSPPTGVAALGVYNFSGRLSPYVVRTSQVLGFFNITEAKVNSANGDPHGATLQLNVVFNGSQQFWLQDVLYFNTQNMSSYLLFNVWNVSYPNATVRVIGTGSYLLSNRVFAGSSYPIKFNFPFSGYLDLTESPSPGGTNVTFGYIIIQDGQLLPPIQRFFGWVLLPSSGQLTVAPSTTGDGTAMDSELVFAGPQGGLNATFTSMNAYLALLYWKDGITPFPAVGDFGVDTLEGASNLSASLFQGLVHITTGQLNESILTNDFRPNVPLTFLTIVNGTRESSLYLTSPIQLTFGKGAIVHEFQGGESLTVNGTTVEVSTSNQFQNVTVVANYQGSSPILEYLLLVALVLGTIFLARRRLGESRRP